MLAQLNAVATTSSSSSISPSFCSSFSLLVIMQSAVNAIELHLYEILQTEYLLRQNTCRARRAPCPEPSK